MESKHIMELVDRIVLLAEENARLRAEITAIKGLLDEAEIKEAEYCLENGGYFHPHVDTSAVRFALDWDMSPEVQALIRRMEEEKTARERLTANIRTRMKEAEHANS